MPGVTVGGNLSGGSNGLASIPGSPLTPIVVSINGTLPYETSTLLDGMPLQGLSTIGFGSTGGATDMSLLPLNGFDAADIVRGPGADSPSIVNSIGGTLVLHSAGQVTGNRFEMSFSNNPFGGLLADFKEALGYGRFSATLIYGANNSPGPLGVQSSIPSLTIAPATVNGAPFQGCTPVHFGPYGTTNACQGYPANVNDKYAFCYCTVQDSLLICCTPNSTYWTQHSGAASLSYRLGDSITAQLYYAGSSTVMEAPLYFDSTLFTPGRGYTGSIAPGLHSFIRNSIPYEGGQASSLLEEKITANLAGGILRLAAVQYNSFTGNESQSANGTYELWGTGYVGRKAPGSYMVFSGKPAAVTFNNTTFITRARDNNRSTLLTYSKPVGANTNIGASYVTSYYNTPGNYPKATYNGVDFCTTPGFCSGTPSAQSATTYEFRAFGDSEISDKLSLGLSWYFAQAGYHYPFATNPNVWADKPFKYNAPRFRATWRASNNEVFRLGMGGGFALPPLATFVSVAGTGSVPVLEPGGGAYTLNIANPGLQPEESFGFDLGTDIRIARDTVGSLDLYYTNLYGQLMTSVAVGTYRGLPLYTTEYANLGRSRFEGINLNIKREPGKGPYWHAALGLTRAYVVSVPPGFYNGVGSNCNFKTGAGCSNVAVVPTINFNGTFESAVPYANGYAQLGYRWGPGTYAEIAPTYYGNNNAYFVPAFVQWDANAGLAISQNVALIASVRNIGGVYGSSYASYTPTGAPTIAGLPYPVYQLPVGPRTLTVTLQLKQ